MTDTDPRTALEEHGTLYDGAAARGGKGQTVHVDEGCHALATDHDEITEPAELPLRTRVCQKCDPDHEIDYSRKNGAPELEGNDGQVRTDGGLPESLTDLADPSTDDAIACRDCGDEVARRFLVDGQCVGCRKAGDGPGGSAHIAGRDAGVTGDD